MTRTVEEMAEDCDMPPWKAAEIMVRLMMRGLVAPPENATVQDHADWFRTAYPKPENVIARKTQDHDRPTPTRIRRSMPNR